jgi:hypothetical protein
MMTRIRKTLKSAAKRAGITKSSGHHIARHAYVSARLQMTEKNQFGKDVPVSPSTIVREVGHATDELIQTTYGHITRQRVNATVLDYLEDPVDFTARTERSAKLLSEAVKAGLDRAKERQKEEEAKNPDKVTLRIADDHGEQKKKRSRGTGGRFAKIEKTV